ncbi:MAG: peptidase domain-containing ABC transporter [Woeseia sp.]
MFEHRGFVSRRRLPIILQQERAECGLACIAMIAGYFGRPIRLNVLRARHPLSPRGATLNDLLQVADGLGLAARPVRLELSELSCLSLPAVLHWKLDHFIVLLRLRRGKAVIHDPARGKDVVSRNELDASFTGVALEFAPAANFERGNERDTLSVASFVRSCRRVGRYLGLMLLLLVVIQLLSLIPPVVTQLLIDEVILGLDPSWLYRALGGLAAVLFVAALLEAVRRWIGLCTGTQLAADMTRNVVGHLYNLPVQFVHNRHLGDIISRLESLDPLRRAITETGINGLVQGMVVVATLSIMLFYSRWLTLVSLGSMVCTALLLAAILPTSRRLSEQALLHKAHETSSLLESLRAIDVVHALGIAPLRLTQWQNHFVLSINARVRAGRLSIWQGFGSNLIAASEQVFFLGIGITALLDQQLTLGVLFAFMALRGRLAQAALNLFVVCQELFMLKLHVGRLSDIVLAEPLPAVPDGAITRTVSGSLHARGLSFAFAGGPSVVRDFSCVIQAGESVVISGPSGCGKTTLLRILSAQLPADGGQLFVDGRELSLWHPRALRRQFATVLQDDAMFNGSLAANIAGFDPEPDLARIRDAADAAEIWQDIQHMPMGMDTLLGDTGSSLSGGQRQRLALARAFYRRPRILFLDEATSHLDIDTECRVLDNIDALRITTVSIAHRPDVLRRAQRIIHLDP